MSTEDSSPQATGSEPELDSLDEMIIEAVGDGDAPQQIDDPYVALLAEYVEDIDPELMRLGWTMENAKSSMYPFYKYDQSMLVHTRTGVFFLLRFIGEVLPEEWLVGRGDREEVLRELVAMFVVHDVHKTRGETTFQSEFNIEKDEIQEFIEKTGVADYAPSLSIDDYHSVAVGLHKTDNAKHEMLSRRFLDLNPFLRLADGVASLSDPENWVSDRQQRAFENAVGNTATPHAHAVEGSGPLASVMNKATAETFEDYDYTLLTIHDGGCTYAASPDQPIGELPGEPDAFLSDLYQNFLEELRTALPRYRNRSILADAAEVMNGQGRYHITDLDVLCLPPRDLLRAIVEQGITHADAPWDLPKYARSALDTLHDETGIDFDRTHRIEGVARIVHTVHETILPLLMRDEATAPSWERNRMTATLAAFQVSPEMQSVIADVYTDHGDGLLMGEVNWPYKYLIAHDLLTRGEFFTGESGSETIEAITTTLATELADFEKWSDYRAERVGHIDAELRALLFSRVRVDDQPLSDYSIPSTVDRYISQPKSECGLCGGSTVAKQVNKPNLIEAPLRVELDSGKYRHIEVEHDGDLIDLHEFCYENKMCFACQLDVELQAADTSWESDESRLHVSVQPEYAYTPLSGIIFSNIIDKYSAVGAERGADFAHEVFVGETSEQSVYDEWMAAHAQNAFGRQMLANLERGFMLGSGYGGHTVSFPLPDGNSREALFAGTFAACVATSYSGLSAYISTHPVISVPDHGRKELVKLSSTLNPVRPAFGGDVLPLHEMSDLLKATSAIRRLGHATGHGHAPVDAYCAYKRNKTYPLVGSQMLATAAEKGNDPAEYASEALHLDSHAAKQDAVSNDLVRDARALGDYAYEILDRPDDPDATREFVGDALDLTIAHGRVLTSDDLAAHLIALVETHESVDLDAFETIEDYISEFAHVLAGAVFNGRHGASAKSLEAARKPLCDGVWAHAVAVNAGDHDTYE